MSLIDFKTEETVRRDVHHRKCIGATEQKLREDKKRSRDEQTIIARCWGGRRIYPELISKVLSRSAVRHR